MKDGMEVDRGRMGAEEGEITGEVTYVEFVSMSLLVSSPGYEESEPEYPRPFHLPLSSLLCRAPLARIYIWRTRRRRIEIVLASN